MKTKVINIKEAGRQPWPKDFVYIGRKNGYSRAPLDVFNPLAGQWGNPYRIGPDGDRTQVIEKFKQFVEDYLHSTKRSGASNTQFKDLKGKTLVCFCKPEACHGDVLAEIVENM